MKRFAAIALLLAWTVATAASASAQRAGGGFHGGGFHGGGHAGPGFHSGSSSPHFSAPRFSGGFAGTRSYRPNAAYPRSRFSPAYRSRFNNTYRSRYRNPDRSGYRNPYRRHGERDRRFRRRNFPLFGAVFLNPIPDWIGLGPVGCYPDADAQVYGGDDGCDDMTADSDEPAVYNGDDPSSTPAPPPDYDQQAPPPEYRQPPPPVSYPAALPATQTATTIVFNDGRPSEQIHNYALTQTTLYVFDQQHRDIPLDKINLAETEKVNQAAGIPFDVPRISQ